MKVGPVLKTKSVWTAADRKRDGLRLLATRFRGCAMPKSRYDVWMPGHRHILRALIGRT